MSEKSCCFIGHRNVKDTKELRQKIQKTVLKLIKNKGVTRFLFGSKSNFDFICHSVVTELQKIHPEIKRIAYTCRHETATLKKDKEKAEKVLSEVLNCSVNVPDYDEEYEHPTKYTSGKASYVERNEAMINDSDFCIFYFYKEYKPPLKKSKNSFLPDSQPKSGTSLAYAYAVKKKKQIYNLCEE